jgi:hypothetical protein
MFGKDSAETGRPSVWQKYLDIAIGLVVFGAILITFSAALKSCSFDLNRDRTLCEKYSKTIKEYDECIMSRKRIER